MFDWRRRLVAGVLFAAAAVVSVAQVTPAPTGSTVTGAPLVVFGATPAAAAATDARQLLRLDGSLRSVAHAAVGNRTVSADRKSVV